MKDRETKIEILFSGIKINRETLCWEWTKSKSSNGYGVIYARIDGKRKMVRMHRLAWEVYNGPIPKGKCVLHQCDVRHCVNPNHLFIGTREDNIRDMFEKGRHRAVRGNKVNTARLTAADVRKVITLKTMLGKDNQIIANMFGVTRGAISKIMNGRNWAHITGIKRGVEL